MTASACVELAHVSDPHDDTKKEKKIEMRVSSSITGGLPGASVAPSAFVAPEVRTFRYDPRRAGQPARDYQRELIARAWEAVSSAPPGARKLVSLATGGGKTRVLNDLLFEHVLPEGVRTLWLAPDWELIAQAMEDGCARYLEGRAQMTYIGGSGTEVPLFGAPLNKDALLTFTTLQTFSARRKHEFANQRFDVIVLDEVHYGEHGSLQRQVYETYQRSSIFIGATATKRADSGYTVVGKYHDLQELVGRGVLARPDLVSVETSVEWSPGVDGTQGEFAATSLDELGRNEARNEVILRTYLQYAHQLGPTILFACNITHAERLTQMLCTAGVRAAATHSEMPAETRKEAISQFRAGDIDVIVNVKSLTMGVDIPRTEGIMLARPTTSDILTTQMIGRGSRRAPNKTSFLIVDFVDVVSGPNGVYIKRPEGFLGSPSWGTQRRRLHEYVPAKLQLISSADAAIDGLGIQAAQTFAVEFTVGGGVASAIVPAIVEKGIESTFIGAPTTNNSSSWLTSTEGNNVRVVSPVYLGAAGLSELVRTMDAIARVLEKHSYGLIDDTIHVLLGWCPDLTSLQNAVQYFGFFEPGLASLAPPPKHASPPRRPARRAVAEVLSLATADAWDEYVNRTGGSYHSFDMKPLFEKGYAVDVLLHAEVLDGRWLAAWVSLAMHILRAAEEDRPLNGDPRRRVQSAPICRGPRGNVDELCAFVGGSAKLADRLRAQRDAMLAQKWVPHLRYGRLARRVEDSWRTSD